MRMSEYQGDIEDMQRLINSFNMNKRGEHYAHKYVSDSYWNAYGKIRGCTFAAVMYLHLRYERQFWDMRFDIDSSEVFKNE